MVEHGVEVCPLAHDYQVGMTDKLQHNWYMSTVYARLYPRNTNMYIYAYTTSMFAFQSGGTWEPGNEANHAYIIIVACFLDNAIYNNCSLRLCVSVKEVLQLC